MADQKQKECIWLDNDNVKCNQKVLKGSNYCKDHSPLINFLMQRWTKEEVAG
jgi:hypothetical protein